MCRSAYVEEREVLLALQLELPFQLLDPFFEGVEVELELLLDLDVLADLALCLLQGEFEHCVVLPAEVA